MQLEDFLPKDPRDVVLTRVDDVVLRLFPGCVERPIADVERALLVADATDNVLIARLGFGVRDLLMATLTFIDCATNAMASAWPADTLPGDGPVELSAAELDAAAGLAAATTSASLGFTPQQERALAWATTVAAEVPYEPNHAQSPFGRFLRVTRHGHEQPASWMPLSHIPEILSFAVAALAGTVATVPEVRRAFARAAAGAARRALWRFSSTVLGTPDLPSGPAVLPGNHIQWVATLGPGRAVLVQLVSELRTTRLPFEDVPAALRIAREAHASPPGTPIRVPTAVGAITLDPNAEVVPLLVVANAGHIAVPQHPGLPAMSLDDLRWAATSTDTDSDLFLFCRDLARPDRPNLLGWEAIDAWEWWRHNGKTLFAGGQRPTAMMIAPHGGDAEWDHRRNFAPLEQGLTTLDLPGLADIDGVDHGRTGPPVAYQWVDPQTLEPGSDRTSPVELGVHRRGDLLGWTLHLSDAPVAIVAAHPGWPHEHHELLHKLSGSFAFGFRQIDDVWRSAHAGGSVRGYVVDLTVTDDDTRIVRMAPSGTARTPGNDIVRVTVEICPDAITAAEDPISATHSAMASVVRDLVTAAALPRATVNEVVAAWEAAPPTLAVRVLHAPTVRNDLLAPLKPEPALIAEVDQVVARAVHDAGVEPGTYTGDAAKALDRDVLAPAALQVLTSRLQAFEMDDVVLTGMREIERAVADRDRQVRDLEQSALLRWTGIRSIATPTSNVTTSS